MRQRAVVFLALLAVTIVLLTCFYQETLLYSRHERDCYHSVEDSRPVSVRVRSWLPPEPTPPPLTKKRCLLLVKRFNWLPCHDLVKIHRDPDGNETHRESLTGLKTELLEGVRAKLRSDETPH
ncbi:MAG: hypothetical protein AAF488_01895 [Planctomycetota bacterium]